MNQAVALHEALKRAKEGSLVVIVARDEHTRDRAKLALLSALPKTYIRAVFDTHVLFENGGEVHFRKDHNLFYGRLAEVYEQMPHDDWMHFVRTTPPLKHRFQVMEEAWSDESGVTPKVI